MAKTNAVQRFILTIIVFIGIQGAAHGIAEILQGNKPTGGSVLETMGAFTLIHNYLYTGIAATAVSIAIIAWGFLKIGSRFFTAGFFLLCVALFFTGGGAAFVLFMIFVLIASLFRNGAGGMVKKMASGKAGAFLAPLAGRLLIITYGCITAGVAVWLIFIPPGELHELTAYHIACWSLLLAGLAGHIPSLFAAIAADAGAERFAGK